jgi:predicted amidohydrolase
VRALRVALAQFGAGLGDSAANAQRMLGFLERARAEGADLVCFPELCVSGYLLDAAAYDDELMAGVGRAEASLAEAAVTAGVAVVYGVPRRTAGGLANVVVHVAADGTTTPYQKTHMDVLERQVFLPGAAFVTTPDHTFGLACCYDLAFPEPARVLAVQGARVLLVPMAWEVRRSFVLEKVAGARALENVAYLVCVNQCGRVGPFAFHGASRVVDPLGDAVITLGNEETLVVVELDLGLVDRLRDRTDDRTYPLLDDRRPGLYAVPPGEAP